MIISQTRLSCCLILVGLSACGGSDAPKTPLGAARPTDAVEGMAGYTAEARHALDSGNNLFRLKDYGAALAQYRRSSELAPAELAPLLGIMMVSDATSNAKLREETLPRIRRLDPGAADSAVVMPHSKIINAHPGSGHPAIGR